MGGTLQIRLGLAVKRHRTKLKLTQEQLSARAELTVGYISRLERGDVCPRVDTLERIGKALRTSGWRLMQEAERGA